MKFLLVVLALLLCPISAQAGQTTMHHHKRGDVVIWTPTNYDPATAELVVYVHGLGTSALGAWKDHQLKKQFEASNKNAMFVVVEAPSKRGDRVRWPDLSDLVRYLNKHRTDVPSGNITALGHSGAYRTLYPWVGHPNLKKIVLLDAMYGGFDSFRKFVRRDGVSLTILSVNTGRNAERFVLSARGTEGKGSKLVHIQCGNNYTHMSLVTSGKIIPKFL